MKSDANHPTEQPDSSSLVVGHDASLPRTPQLRKQLEASVKRAGRSFWKQPLVLVGLGIIAFWITVGFAAPWIPGLDPFAQASPRFMPPSREHWMGTDALGRDMLSRVVFGVRITLPYALIIVTAGVAIGALVGSVAGYAGGAVDEFLMRATDIVFAVPSIVLAMTVAAALGPGLRNATIAIIIVAWPPTARIVRSMVLSLRTRNYVSAHQLLGAGPVRTMRMDFTPNMIGPVAVLAMIEVGERVLLLSALSFLGLGAQPPVAEWGRMVADGARILDRWWIATFPGFAILSAVLAFNLVGDTLRDVLDPQVSKQMKG